MPAPYTSKLQNPIPNTNTLPIIIPYPNTLPNILEVSMQHKTCQQLIKVDHEKALNFVSQSESKLTSPKNIKRPTAMVEDLS